MISAVDRIIGHLELYLHESRKEENPLDLNKALQSLWKKKDNLTGNPYTVDDFSITLFDVDFDPKKNAYTFLFTGISKNSSDAAYANFSKPAVRNIKKLAGEGGAVSAHLCISANPKVSLCRSDNASTHRALLEEVTGLNRNCVINFLKKLIQENVSFCSDDGKKGIKPILESNIICDKPILDQLEHSDLLSVTFVQRGDDCMDSPDGFIMQSRSIIFKPKENRAVSTIKTKMKSLLNSENFVDYKDIRIKIKDSNGKQRTSIMKNKSDLLTRSFQKKDYINNIDPPLPSATQKIIDYFANQIKSFLV